MKRNKFIAPTTLKTYTEVFALIRNQFTVWIARKEIEKKARISHGKYKCDACGGLFGRKDRQIDHIIPIGKTPKLPKDLTLLNDSHFIEIGKWFFRVFCPKENLQCLCLKDHKLKSAKEAEQRSGGRK